MRLNVNTMCWHKRGGLFKFQLFLAFYLFISSSLYGTNYYVSTSGSNSNNGTSLSTPFLTVTYAAKKATTAGDTVYIKAGSYSSEAVVVSGSGTSGHPIVFQGYYQKPGDTPNPQYVPSSSLNSSLIPVLDGGSNYDVISIGYNYIVIRNLGLTGGTNGIDAYGTNYLTLENVYTKENGWGNSSGVGIYIMQSTYFNVKNCVVTDAGMANLMVRQCANGHGVVNNCISYAVGYSSDASDYHICLQDAQYITVKNCKAYNLHYSSCTTAGHGIGIKDEYKNGAYNNPHSIGDSIINCSVYDCGEYFFVAHESYNNVFLNCNAYGHYETQAAWSEGITIRDGAHDNTFKNMYIHRVANSITYQNTSEGPTSNQISLNNLITNSRFVNSAVAVYYYYEAENNTIKNCVFDSTGKKRFFRYDENSSSYFFGNSLKNCIITNSTGDFSYDLYCLGVSPTITYTDFYSNSFCKQSGTGNLSVDPLFVDASNHDYHLKSIQGHWTESSSSWTIDSKSSPCIDTGNPSDDYSSEPSPYGIAINMGAYGGTTLASKSPNISSVNETSNDNYDKMSIFPNPFSSESKIMYTSNSIKQVTISVYDMQGRLVKILFDDNFSGELSVQWDGTNDSNQEVSHGIYIVNLKTSLGENKSQKILFR